MRVIKLSADEEFPTREKMERYFTSELPSRYRPGQFNLTKGKITPEGKTTLFEGEMLFFSWKGEVVRVGRAGSGIVKPETPVLEEGKSYPYFFIVDIESLKQPLASLTLKDLDEIIPPLVDGDVKKISGAQGWNWAPETEKLEDWFDSIC